jgi:hypothetical protein
MVLIEFSDDGRQRFDVEFGRLEDAARRIPLPPLT